MTYHELYVLNSALDGEDIYSVMEFSRKRLSQAMAGLIKASLIQKGFLENDSLPTRMGAGVVRLIKQFKEAKKYIRILDMVIGCVDAKKGILLRQKKGDFTFSAINLKESANSFAEVFPALFNGDESEESTAGSDIHVSPRQLLTKYPTDAKTSFTIMTDHLQDKQKNTKELFFGTSGKKYYYDCTDQMLHERCSQELFELLQKRMEVQ